MINIKMNTDKTLSVINIDGLRIMQNDNLVDKIHILIPSTYRDMDLSDFQAELHYTTPGNVPYDVLLQRSVSQDKENYIAYVFPVDNTFTAVAGEVKNIFLLLTKTVVREGGLKPLLYKIHTDTTQLTIHPSTTYNSAIGSSGGNDEEFEVVEF